MRHPGSHSASEVSRWDVTLGTPCVSMLCAYPLLHTRNSSPFLEIPGDVEELVLDIIYELPLLLRSQRLSPNIN